jgi:glycosyltransferase involved in cell wall biosynthesis
MSVDEQESGPAFTLDGAGRREKAMALWRGWRLERRSTGLLFGISGVGKSEMVVRPLVDWAHHQGVPTVWVQVPADTIGGDALLLEGICGYLADWGHAGLAAVVETLTVARAITQLLSAGALVIIDEFQRELDSDGRPSEPMSRLLERLGMRPSDAGYLLLVSNRRVHPSWTEPLHIVELTPPGDDDAVEIILPSLSRTEAAERLPDGRRSEVVRRLGHNPRALRLLGLLLAGQYALNDLLPPEEADFTEPPSPDLVRGVEENLVRKAAEGLHREAREFLWDLSVLRGWAGWDIVEAVSAPGTDVPGAVRLVRDRYLLEVRDPARAVHGGRYQVHPLLHEASTIHMRRNEVAWRAAHRRAGEWYARKLTAAGRTAVHDRTLLLGLDGAWYHYTAAGLASELPETVRPVRSFVDRFYGESAVPPRTAGERNARIALLEMYNAHWGTPGTHYHLAVLLRDRGGPGDLEVAKTHARRAADDRDHSVPWVLWVKLVRAVDGSAAALDATREAAGRVAPDKNLYSVYQLMASVLNELGRTEEAVAALRDGFERVVGNRVRLVELAIQFAAAESTGDLLDDLCTWLLEQKSELNSPLFAELSPQLFLAKALQLERRDRWAEALAVVTEGRGEHPKYIGLVVQESLCHLALGDVPAAEAALATYPLDHGRMKASTWCSAFAALEVGRLARAAELLGVYLGGQAPSTADGIRRRLLTEWDLTVAQQGTPIPSLVFPILPPALTGLPTVVIRAQHGGPVLPQRQPDPEPAPPRRPRVLALATAWSPTSGGVNTFNRRLCLALAAGASVTCVVLDATEEERQEAIEAGVTLIATPPEPGASDSERLSRRRALPADVGPEVIIGHGRWTGRAADRLAEHYPRARQVHVVHVIPEDIERFKPAKEGIDAAELAEERQEVERALGTDASVVVAVGPRIHRTYVWDLERYGADKTKVIQFNPGFDAGESAVRQPPEGRWVVLVAGRMEDAVLKGLDLAAKAFTDARRRRNPSDPPIELLVRGAPPKSSTTLEERLREWADDPSLPVRVQSYTTRADRLAADLRGASLVLMPSRAEGFGLVAAEAIVAGTPVLVSAESGLADLLWEFEPEEAGRIVVPVTGDQKRDVRAWGEAIRAMLRDRDAEFRRVAALRERLAARLTWSGAAAALLERLVGSDPSVPNS